MALNTELNVSLNTRPAEQQIERLTSRNYAIKLNIDSQPLGRITGQLSEFNKSMDAANARVVAFGASAGAIAILEKSFHALIDSTIEVQKALKSIQVLLDASDGVMNKFGKNLFDIARNTGQSFSAVSDAAAELARQGLSMEETLKRTNDALVLSRLSGLSAAESVQTLTATVNSFASQAVQATEVVNKFANVDAAFAVGSKDLAEGVSRVGSAASEAGVSLDELIALITSAQAVTARGGAVIGNSFKTIFTRLERGKTQSLLESLGVDTKDDTGRVKSTIALLQDLARVYGTLSQGKQADVAEKVGGVFQINVLKAALGDLGKEYSIYNNALQTSLSTTDEATQRNQKLNETYSAQINRLQQSASQLAASAGKQIFGPSMDRVLGAGNGILDSLNNIDTNSIGGKLGKGLLDGIGQVIAGPGLALIGGVIIKLLGDFSKFAGGSVKELLGLNGASKEQAAIQQSINKLLEKNPSLLAQINSAAKTQADQAKILLDFYTKQTAEMQRQATLTAEIASKLYTGGVRMGPQGVPISKKAGGHIPEFASEEAQAKMLGAKNPRAEWGRGTIGGQRFIKNSEEDEIVGFGRNGDSAVIPRYSNGYIPNFAAKIKDGGVLNERPTSRIGLVYGRKSEGISDGIGYFKVGSGDNQTRFGLRIPAAGLNLPAATKPDDSDIENKLSKNLLAFTNTWIQKLGGYPTNKISSIDDFTNAGSFASIVGTIFETAVTYATSTDKRSGEQGGQTARIDFVKPNEQLQKLFHGLKASRYEAKYTNTQKMFNSVAEKAYAEGLIKDLLPESASEEVKNTRKSSRASGGTLIPKGGKIKPFMATAAGYIPNFADALHDSIAREIGAGAPAGDIYVKKYGQLASENNPEGLGVFNRRDEGSVSKEMRAMRKKGYARGYVPNFADADGSSGNVGAGIASMAVNFALLMSAFRGTTEETKKKSIALQQEKQAQIQAQEAIIKTQRAFIETAKAAGATSSEIINASRKIGMANQEIQKLSQLSIGGKISSAVSSAVSSASQGLQSIPGYQKAQGALSGKLGGALTFAPLLTEQVSQFIPKDSTTGRGASQTVSSLGTIASFAGAGAMIGGPFAPLTAAAGAAVGAFLEIPKVVNAFTDKMPELTSQLNVAKDGFNVFKSQSDEYLRATDELNSAIEQGTTNQETLSKLIKARADALAKMPIGEQANIVEEGNKNGTKGEMKYLMQRQQSESEDVARYQRAVNNEEIRKAALDNTYSNTNNSGFIKAERGVSSQILEGLAGGKTGKEAQAAISKIDTSQLDKALKGNSPTWDLEKFLKSNNISSEVIGNSAGVGGTEGGSQQLIKDLMKNIESTKRLAAAEEESRQIIEQKRPIILAENTVRKENIGMIEKQISAIKSSSVAYEYSYQRDLARNKATRDFAAKSESADRSGANQILETITGKTNLTQNRETQNKIADIRANSANSQKDIIDESLKGLGTDLSKIFDQSLTKPKKSTSNSEDSGAIYDVGDDLSKLQTSAFKGTEGQLLDRTTGERSDYYTSIGKNQMGKQQEVSDNIKNALAAFAQSGGNDSDKQELSETIRTELGKTVEASNRGSTVLDSRVQELTQKAIETRDKIIDVKTATEREVDATNKAAEIQRKIQNIIATQKSFGGIGGFMENKPSQVGSLASLFVNSNAAEKKFQSEQRMITSESGYKGERNIERSRSLLNLNKGLKDFLGGGANTGQEIGKGMGVENIMVQGRTEELVKQYNELQKASKKGDPRAQAMFKERTEQFITSTGQQDISSALREKARLEIASETGHFSQADLLKMDNSPVKALGIVGKDQKEQEEKLQELVGKDAFKGIDMGGDKTVSAIEVGNKIQLEQLALLKTIADNFLTKQNISSGSISAKTGVATAVENASSTTAPGANQSSPNTAESDRNSRIQAEKQRLIKQAGFETVHTKDTEDGHNYEFDSFINTNPKLRDERYPGLFTNNEMGYQRKDDFIAQRRNLSGDREVETFVDNATKGKKMGSWARRDSVLGDIFQEEAEKNIDAQDMASRGKSQTTTQAAPTQSPNINVPVSINLQLAGTGPGHEEAVKQVIPEIRDGIIKYITDTFSVRFSNVEKSVSQLSASNGQSIGKLPPAGMVSQ